MNCAEFHDLLQRRLDGGAGTGELAAHAAGCSDCRAWLAAVQRLESGLQVLPRPRPGVGSAEKIVASVLTDQRARRRRRYAVRAALALAAAILFAILIAQRVGQRDQDVAVASLYTAPAVQKSDRAPGHERISPSLRESVTGVAQLTIRSADETVRTFLTDAAVNNPKPSPLTASVVSLREAGASVTTGLEPVADSAKRAFNLFWRENPATRTNDRRGS
jgi:hypothetical protein